MTPLAADKDRVREAFEFWYSDEGTWPKAVEKDAKGRYVLAGATAAWDAWKACAAAMSAAPPTPEKERGSP